MEPCLDTEICLGSQAPKRWWEQEGLVFPGIKAAREEGRAGDRRGDRSGGRRQMKGRGGIKGEE